MMSGFMPWALQRAHDADMGEAARRAAAEYKSDRWSAAFDADMAGVDGFVFNIRSSRQPKSSRHGATVCTAEDRRGRPGHAR